MVSMATMLGGMSSYTTKESAAWFWNSHTQSEIDSIFKEARETLSFCSNEITKINNVKQAKDFFNTISATQNKYAAANKKYKEASSFLAAANKIKKDVVLALNCQEIELRNQQKQREIEAKRLEDEHRRKMEEQRLQMEAEEQKRLEDINNMKIMFSERLSAIRKNALNQIETEGNINKVQELTNELEEKIAQIDNLNRSTGIEVLFEDLQAELAIVLADEAEIQRKNLEQALSEAKKQLFARTDELDSLLSNLNTDNENFETIKDEIQNYRSQISQVDNLNDVQILFLQFNQQENKINTLVEIQRQEEEEEKRLKELERNIMERRNPVTQLELLTDKQLSLDEVIGGNTKAKAKTAVLIRSFKNFSETGRAPLSKGILYYGDPGTGKTSLAKAMAAEAGMELFFINPSLAMSEDGERKVLDVIENAKKAARISGVPVILLIDEIDAIAQKRSLTRSDKVLVLLMNEIDKLNPEDNVIIIATTNRRQDLDSAIIRSGRIDQSVEIGLPNAEDKLKILKIYLQLLKLDKDINLIMIVDKMKNFNGADIKRTVETALNLAMYQQQVNTYSKVVLTNSILLEAIANIIYEK